MGTPKRFAARRDGNEGPLIRLARVMGARVKVCGPLDCWIHTARTGWVPVEIKNPDGYNRYTPDQIDFREWCAAWKMPTFTWRTREDVIKALGGEDTWNKLTRPQQKSLSPVCAKPPNGGSASSESPSTSAVKIADSCL